ncbi:Aldo/keto reductase [Neolentinus lepideus HHB14362 ss-1]|uniref:Aldo/keto reductase n=1 Tax=Neolentinus lepideus HHB14362 ss-1 TaxID=1314782 RepID=A0A165NVV9_9AGAM|nr:Aldo/keto reductase [Neolentinus lepideus HHB14362 ss-1]
MSLPTRKIGSDSVTAIGYGAMGISAFYGKAASDEERLKFLDELYGTGCTNWDTANAYLDSEELIGKWFKRSGKRKDIFLATKFGFTNQADRMVNGEPEYAKQCLETSLKRLGTDYVNLYYLHRADPKVPIELTVGAMADMVKQGKVKYLGLSEISADTLRRAHAVHPIAAIQVEYSPFTLDIEDEKVGLLKTARELGVKIVAYSPLGRGLLTGRYKSPDDFEDGDFRKIVPRYSKENFPNILKLADGLKVIGERRGATAGQVALAWLLAQGDDIIPIPGTTKAKYLRENLDASKLKLTQEDIAEVRSLAENSDAVRGLRYPPVQVLSSPFTAIVHL